MSISWQAAVFIFILIVYTISFFTTWIYTTHKVIRSYPFLSQVILFAISLWCMLVFVEYFFFVPLGANFGNPFFNPLIPFTQYPSLLWHLPHLGMLGSLAFFCLLSSAITLALQKKTILNCLLLASCLLIWVYGLLEYQPVRTPDWVDSIIAIQIMLSSEKCTAVITDCINQITDISPPASLFILPESACQKKPEWQGDETVILGGYHQIEGVRYNTLFWFVDNQEQMFCKQSLLPIIEQKGFLSSGFGATLPNQPPYFSRPIIKLNNFQLVPLICSELFLLHDKPIKSACPLLCISNDWWFQCNHMPRLMLKVACLKAIEWQTEIVYISYRFACFIAPNGIYCQLKKLP